MNGIQSKIFLKSYFNEVLTMKNEVWDYDLNLKGHCTTTDNAWSDFLEESVPRNQKLDFLGDSAPKINS